MSWQQVANDHTVGARRRVQRSLPPRVAVTVWTIMGAVAGVFLWLAFQWGHDFVIAVMIIFVGYTLFHWATTVVRLVTEPSGGALGSDSPGREAERRARALRLRAGRSGVILSTVLLLAAVAAIYLTWDSQLRWLQYASGLLGLQSAWRLISVVMNFIRIRAAGGNLEQN